MHVPTTSAARPAIVAASDDPATAGEADDRPDGDEALRLPAAGAAWFVALCVALAGGAAVVSASMATVVPFALALGPAVIALALAWREGPAAISALRTSLTRRPARARWYLVLALPVAWALAVVAVAVATGSQGTGLFDHVAPAVLVVPLVALLPAFAEELAWRGFALPRTMTLMSPLRASLLLAIPWTVMHLVLQLPGGMNEGIDVWPGVVSLFAYSVILTWVYLGTGGSVLMVALLHAGLNGIVPLMSGVDPDVTWAIRAVIAALIAIAVVALGGFRGLGDRHSGAG